MATFVQVLLSKLISAIGTTQPTLPLGQYNAVLPTLADGEATNLQLNGTGRLMVDADIAAGGALATEATLSTVSGNVATLVADRDGRTEAAFVNVRTFSSTAADTEPPLDASFVTVPQLGAQEFKLGPGFTFAGTVAATQVRFRYWGRVSAGTPQVFKIHEEILDASQLALSSASNAILSRRFNCQCDQVFVTVTFLDGTSPTITGAIDCRPIALQARDNSIVKRDETTGNPIAQSPAYDGLTGADKAALINDLYPALPEVGVISETSRASGSTYYWPSADGIEMGNGYDTLGIQFSITGAATSATSTTIEGTINGTTWENITLGTLDCTTGATLSGAITTTAGANVAKLLAVYGAGVVSKIRVAVVVTTANTGAVSASFRRLKAGGGMR